LIITTLICCKQKGKDKKTSRNALYDEEENSDRPPGDSKVNVSVSVTERAIIQEAS
jgi:hypothetical protein